MKKYSFAVLFLMVSFLAVKPAIAQNSKAGMERLKLLEGDWQGLKPDGQAVEVSYEIMSGGTSVVETLKPVNEPTMVTVYHLDGNKLMMTHYCSAGNQPRMVAEMPGRADSEIDFNFMDATNLKDKSEGHMRGLKIIFVDENHIKQTWNWSKDGEHMPATFEFTRKKMGSK